jgi:hypothetical protein
MSIQKDIINNEVKKENYSFYIMYRKSLENVFELFHIILKDPFTNIWWDTLTLILEYIHLLVYITHKKVSK